MAIHPAAVIDASSHIDPSTEIGPYAVVGPDCVIGPNCRIGAHAVLEHVQMGRENVIHPGAYVGTAPQDLKYKGEKTRLVMGDRNVVRECATLNRGTIPPQGSGQTRIGNDCLFMAYSHVAHDCVIQDGAILVNSVALAGHVTVGDHAVLGGLCAVHQFTRIGRLAMIGGGAMVGQDVLPYTTCQGDRAVLRGLNLLGLRRAKAPRESVSAIKDAYKLLFLSGLPQIEALSRLKTPDAPKEVREWVDFIESSQRGVMRPATGATAIEEATV